MIILLLLLLLLIIGIPMELYSINIEGNAAKIAPAMNELINLRNVSFIIAPESSFVGAAAQIASAAGISIIAGMGGANSLFKLNKVRPYKMLFSPLTPSPDYYSPGWPLANLKGYRTIGVITSDFAVYSDVCLGSLERAKRDFDMVVVSTIIITTNSTCPTCQHAQFRSRIVELKQKNPDILVSCYAAACHVLFDTLVDIGYNPKMHMTFECVNTMPSVVPMDAARYRQLTNARYSISPTQFDPSLRGDQFRDDAERPYANMYPETNQTSLSSAMQFYQAYQGWPNAPSFSSLTASELAAYYMMEYAVYKTQSTDKRLLVNALQSINIKGSFFGLLTSDEYGQNSLRPIPLSQLGAATDRQTATLVAPQSAARYVIMPMPTFGERVHQPVRFSPAVTVILVLVILFTLFNIIAVALLIRYRSNPAIRSKKALLTILISICSAFLYWTVLTWLPDSNSSLLCGIQRPFFLVSAASSFTVIAAITYRISKIFNNTRLQVISSKDHDLVRWIIVLLLPALLVAIIFGATSPSTPTLFESDAYRPSLSFIECSSWPFEMSVCYILVLGFYMCLAIYYALKVRGVGLTYSMFNDARRIGMLTFVSTVIYIVIGTVQFAFIDPAVSRQSWFVIRSMFLLLVPFFATCLWCALPLYEAIKDIDNVNPYTATTADGTKLHSGVQTIQPILKNTNNKQSTEKANNASDGNTNKNIENTSGKRGSDAVKTLTVRSAGSISQDSKWTLQQYIEKLKRLPEQVSNSKVSAEIQSLSSQLITSLAIAASPPNLLLSATSISLPATAILQPLLSPIDPGSRSGTSKFQKRSVDGQK